MIDDTKLQHDVQAALEWEPSLDASKIGVTAKESVVTLTDTPLGAFPTLPSAACRNGGHTFARLAALPPRSGLSNCSSPAVANSV